MSPSAEPAADVRLVSTPEGVPLRFVLAPLGARIGAFAFDFFIVFGSLGLLSLLVGWAFGGAAGGYALAVLALVGFLLRSFYFAFFELAWQGLTPGKRRHGIRVVDAGGGRLTAEAVFARNLMRELEVFVPLNVLLAGGLFVPGDLGWIRWGAVLWVFVFALLPLFNRDRLRAGDLVGGTRVVLSPRVALLADPGAAGAVGAVFTAAQLDHYGVFELQVLEDLLRRWEEGRVDAEALDVVRSKIQQRIGWAGPAEGDPLPFLRAFYAAQRARLERGLLFGERRADKRAARKGAADSPRKR